MGFAAAKFAPSVTDPLRTYALSTPSGLAALSTALEIGPTPDREACGCGSCAIRCGNSGSGTPGRSRRR